MLLVLLNELHYYAALTFDFNYFVAAVVVDFHSRSMTADKTPVIELFDSVCCGCHCNESSLLSIRWENRRVCEIHHRLTKRVTLIGAPRDRAPFDPRVEKILLAHKSCGRSASSFYSNISPAARLGTMIAGSETASEASWTSFQTQAHAWEAIERPAGNLKYRRRISAHADEIQYYFSAFFPSDWNKRQAIKPSPLAVWRSYCARSAIKPRCRRSADCAGFAARWRASWEAPQGD